MLNVANLINRSLALVSILFAISASSVPAIASCDHNLRHKLLERLAQEGRVREAAMVPTTNAMGASIVNLDAFVEAFLADAVQGSALEIGAGVGLTAATALDRGAKNYTVNDADPGNLATFSSILPPQIASQVTILPGRFPSQVIVPARSVNSILVARVLHFVPPAAFQQFLGALRDALKPGGRVVVTGLTPWNSHFQTFLPTYQANLERGDEWPGWGMRPAEHNPALAQNLPEVMNMLDLNVLGREFIRAGFRIIRGAYIDRRGQYPDSVLMNGREGVGIIAERIGG